MGWGCSQLLESQRNHLGHLRTTSRHHSYIAVTAPIAAIGVAAATTPAQGATAAVVTALATQAIADALEANNAKAIIIMIHHMDESLQSEYLNEEDPRRL